MYLDELLQKIKASPEWASSASLKIVFPNPDRCDDEELIYEINDVEFDVFDGNVRIVADMTAYRLIRTLRDNHWIN